MAREDRPKHENPQIRGSLADEADRNHRLVEMFSPDTYAGVQAKRPYTHTHKPTNQQPPEKKHFTLGVVRGLQSRGGLPAAGFSFFFFFFLPPPKLAG